MIENRANYLSRLKVHYFAHPDEVKGLGYSILVAAFILSFDKWGGATFDAAAGVVNFLAALVICAIGVIIHDAAHRITAIKMGYEIEHKIWFAGMAASLALVIVTRGVIKIFLFESMIHSPIRLHRMGRYPFMGTTWEYNLLYASGPVASLLLAGVLAAIGSAAGISGGLLGMTIQFNLIYGLLALLPFPPLDGTWMLYYSRGVYTGLFVGSLAYVLMTLLGLTGLAPILIAVFLGIVSGIFWMFNYEGK